LIGMTAHVLYPVWDSEHPATLSARIIRDVIRGEIGFGGLLLSDDLDMQALRGTIPERAAAAVAAGCDLALNCWGRMDDMVGIAEALPAISDAGATRLDAALAGTGGVVADRARWEELVATRDALLALAALARRSMPTSCASRLRGGRGRSTCCSIWRGGRRWICGGYRFWIWWSSMSRT